MTPLLTTEDIAAQLGITPGGARDFLASPNAPRSFRRGRRLYVEPDDWEAYKAGLKRERQERAAFVARTSGADVLRALPGRRARRVASS